jgi:hypothetical protein
MTLRGCEVRAMGVVCRWIEARWLSGNDIEVHRCLAEIFVHDLDSNVERRLGDGFFGCSLLGGVIYFGFSLVLPFAARAILEGLSCNGPMGVPRQAHKQRFSSLLTLQH